jgi:hypothetical protein
MKYHNCHIEVWNDGVVEHVCTAQDLINQAKRRAVNVGLSIRNKLSKTLVQCHIIRAELVVGGRHVFFWSS